MKVINLLCKGRSLTELKTLPECDMVVLANDFDEEIIKFKYISEYLSSKKIHLVLNMVAGASNGYHSINFFDKFNVAKLVRPYLEGIRTPGSSGQGIPLTEYFLGMHHKEFMYSGRKYGYDYAGTGIAAFAYSILDCSVNTINIIGLDFYDNLNYGTPKYLVPCIEGRDYKRDSWTIEEMQENFCKLIKSKPYVQVNLTTNCKNFISEMEKIKNLNIKQVELK